MNDWVVIDLYNMPSTNKTYVKNKFDRFVEQKSLYWTSSELCLSTSDEKRTVMCLPRARGSKVRIRIIT